MKLITALILFSCLLLTGLAMAKDIPGELQAVEIDSYLSGNSARQTCQVGNYDYPNLYTYLNDGDLWGLESYKLIFSPEDQCPNCAVGFTVETVYMIVLFGEEDVPSEFTVSADIEEAIWDGECWDLDVPTTCTSWGL